MQRILGLPRQADKLNLRRVNKSQKFMKDKPVVVIRTLHIYNGLQAITEGPRSAAWPPAPPSISSIAGTAADTARREADM